MEKGNLKAINGGDEVYGSDRRKIGSIEYCQGNYCKVHTGSLGVDYYVPPGAIADTQPGEVFLNVSSERVGRMGWGHPPKKTSAGVRRDVVTTRETEKQPHSPEEEIGETEPM